mmetsp:Transcript_28530/g.88772  ORF Transcript_28530/g.88772 Transcript_28530/m.88772 type:complete len:156 (-) Transcript_28530:65-532(-)
MAIVAVDLGGMVEQVVVDEETGPKILDIDGSLKGYNTSPDVFSVGFHPADHKGRRFKDMSTTERSVLLNIVAKVNFRTRERMRKLSMEPAAMKAATRSGFEGPDEPAKYEVPMAGAAAPKYKRRPPYFTGLLIDPAASEAAPARAKKEWWSGQVA